MLTPEIGIGGNYRAQVANQFGENAVLYLFSKRYMPDQFRRSFVYNFNDRVTNAIAEKVERVATAGGISPGACYLRGLTDAAGAILPEASGKAINTAAFREQWTFLLIVDKEGTGAPWDVNPLRHDSPVKYRDVYSGWIIDEPVSTVISNFTTDSRYNPGAVFTVTHHTRLASTVNVMSSGVCNSVSVLENFDFANGATMQNLQNDGTTLFDLRPAKVVNGIAMDTGWGGSATFAGTAVTTYGNGSMAFESGFNNPTQHMQKLVNGMCDMSRLFRSNGSDLGIVPDQTYITSELASCLETGDGRMSMVATGIDPTIPFTFETLNQKYPGLKVQVIRQPETAQVEYVNAGAPTQQNVMSAMLSAALPDIMIQHGLCDVAFSYCSWQQPPAGSGIPGERGIFEFQNVGPLYLVEPATLEANCINFRRNLFMDIFPLITATCGDFYLMVNASIGGETLIDLKLQDFGSQNQNGFYEQSNRLGGVNTSLVGGQSNFENNSAQMANTTQSIVNASSVPSSLFDFPSAY